jgi:hypothetical protein
LALSSRSIPYSQLIDWLCIAYGALLTNIV